MDTQRWPAFKEHIPITEKDLEYLFDEAATSRYSLFKEYQNSSLSTRTMGHLAQFVRRLSDTFGDGMYEETVEAVQGRIPSLITSIRKEEHSDDAEDRIAFLAGLYGRLNHSRKMYENRW